LPCLVYRLEVNPARVKMGKRNEARDAKGRGRVRRSRRELHERFVSIDRRTERTSGNTQEGTGRRAITVTTVDADAFNHSTPVAADMEDNRGREIALLNEDNERNYAEYLEAESVPLDDRLVSSLDVTNGECLEDAVYAENEVASSEEEEEGSLCCTRVNEIGTEQFNEIQDHCHATEAPYSSPLRSSRATEQFNAEADALQRRVGVLVKWQSIFAVLLSSGTVRMTVEHYETLRDTLRWQSVYLGAEPEALPGIRKIQRRLIPLLREFCYARSDVLDLRKRSGGTGKVRVVLPSEWARLDTCTAPLFEALYGRRSSCANNNNGPSFVFEDIENVPIVCQRQSTIDASRYIFVDAAPNAEHTQRHRIPVIADVGDSIQVMYTSCPAADQIIDTGITDGVQTNASSRELTCRIMSIWGLGQNCSTCSESAGSQNAELFSKCSSMKPGDTLVELCLKAGEHCGDHLCVLVYRFRRDVPGEATKQLYFIPKAAVADGELNSAICTVCPVTCVQHTSGLTGHRLSMQHVPCAGFLKDGRRYVIYRVLLYTDDFQPYSSRRTSYGGCYMLPMGLPPTKRSGYGAVRCIGLTPPQVSTNEVLQHIIPDLVASCTKGVDGQDPSGNPVTIFVDVLGFIGDYPAVSHALDVLGHNSRAPCHLCSFLRQDRIGNGALSYYGYTNEVHSKATAFCRSVQRMKSLRAEELSSQELTSLGFQPTFNAADYPLHALSDALCAARMHVPLTEGGLPVVPAVFDPYRSSMVAPDHLLFGLAQDVIRATIAVCTPRARRIADVLMTSSLRNNKLGKQSQIINPSSASVNSMGMSDMFAVLLVAPVCFESAMHLEGSTEQGSTRKAGMKGDVGESPAKKRKVARKAALPPHASNRNRSPSPGRSSIVKSVQAADMLHLLTTFQRLVRETHFWPCSALDGATLIQEFNDRNGSARLDTLYGLAADYISELHDLCLRDSVVVGKHLNKPNVHRLLELYTHTIPAFGHCKHVQELLFETAHQPLKRAIARSNQRDPHLSAVTATLANDWECRLSIEVKRLGEPESWTAEQCTRLQRLIAGRENQGVSDLRDIRAAFCSPVLSQLQKVERKLSSRGNDHVVWKMQFEDVKLTDTFECWRALSPDNINAFKDAVKRIRCSTRPMSFEPVSLRVAKYACSWYALIEEMQGGKSVADSRRRFGDIIPGSVVQALVAGDNDLGRDTDEVRELQTPKSGQDLHSTSFRVTFWFVLGLFEASVCGSRASTRLHEELEVLPYAIVLPCCWSGSGSVNDPVRVDPASATHILSLSQSVRETMCIHACARAACILVEDDCVEHNGLLGSGTPFYVFGRREGYPPRIG
jgi:hypothetical protein